MEDFLPLDVFQVLAVVADYRVDTISCPPATFSGGVTKLLHQGIQKDVLKSPHPNPECSEKCNNCLLFAALTAVQAVFGYDSSQLTKTAKHLNLHKCIIAPNERESYSHQKILSYELIENMNKWYSAAAEILVTNHFLNLLIEYVKSSCTFTAFLAKKSLLSALKANLYKVHDFIRLVEENWQAGINPCSSFVEVVNNLLSYKVPYTSVCSETFACLQSLGYIHNFLSIKTDPKTKTFLNTDGIFDYLCLIHKLMKCGLKLIDCGLSKVSDYSPLCSLLQNSILPYSDTFYSTIYTGTGKAYCIYFKHLECLSSLFDITFLHPSSVPPHCIVIIGSQVSKALLRCLHTPFLYTQLLDCNFVSSKLLEANYDHRPEDPKDGISAITKLLVDSVLRVHAIISIGSEHIEPSVPAQMFSLLFKVQELVTKCDKDSEDWLTILFADQDDKWISSLLCLLVLHRKLQSRLEELKQQTNTATVANNNDFELIEMEKLLRFICPHRLFLQLAKFIGYDHLVLADFLTSPETHFLSYLSQYLHTVRENWTNFYMCILSLSSDCQKVDTTFSSKANNPIAHNVETGGTSAIHNQTVLPNSTETIINPIVYLVEDCRSYHPYLPKHSNNLLLDFKSRLTDDEKLDECKINDNDETDESESEVNDFQHLKFRDAGTKPIVLVSYSDSEDNEEEETTDKSNLIGGKSCYSDNISAISTEESILPATNVKESTVCVNEDSLCKKNSTDFDKQNEKESSKGSLEIPEELVLVMEMFIRLRLYLERLVGKNMFPYNVQPLILLLEVCEDFYDNFCTSLQM